MSNPSGRKGSGWESALSAHFTENNTFDREVFRAPKWGVHDKGDLTNTRDFTIQAKAVKAFDLSGWLSEVAVQKKNAGKRWGAVVIKRRNHSVDRAYVLMEMRDWADFVKEFYNPNGARHAK